jgi:hypothetical protein
MLYSSCYVELLYVKRDRKKKGIHSFKPALLASHSEMYVGLMTQAKEALTRLEVPVG